MSNEPSASNSATTPYFPDEDEGFFGLANEVWAEADRRREVLKDELGEEVGQFIADVNQYGAAWTGDAWEWTAVGAENMFAFATIPPRHPWDTKNYGWVLSTRGPGHPSYSSGWGGWTKPHKERGPVNDEGMIEGIGADLGNGWCIFMPKGYL